MSGQKSFFTYKVGFDLFSVIHSTISGFAATSLLFPFPDVFMFSYSWYDKASMDGRRGRWADGELSEWLGEQLGFQFKCRKPKQKEKLKKNWKIEKLKIKIRIKKMDQGQKSIVCFVTDNP